MTVRLFLNFYYLYMLRILIYSENESPLIIKVKFKFYPYDNKWNLYWIEFQAYHATNLTDNDMIYTANWKTVYYRIWYIFSYSSKLNYWKKTLKLTEIVTNEIYELNNIIKNSICLWRTLKVHHQTKNVLFLVLEPSFPDPISPEFFKLMKNLSLIK